MTLAAAVAAAAPPSAGSRRRATRVARPRALPSRLDARTGTRRGRGACPALSESFVAAAASAERDAGDASTSASAGALSIVDSTEDVFAAFCESQVELVARALGRGARCMLYLRSPGTAGDSLQLEEVASFPPSSRWDDDGEGVGDGDGDDAAPFISPSSFGTAASSFADSLGGSAAGPSNPPLGGGSITLSGGGSVDDADGPMTAAEALLVKQRVFALPSTNALVVPLSRDAQLLGLLVGEMPEGGGWRKNRVSARTRKERERRATRDGDAPEVEVLSAAAGEEEEREAQDTAAQFGDRRQAALSAAARSIVAAWSMRLRAEYATAAAVRSDRRVAGFTYAAKEPLTVLRTLGGMLTSHLKPDTPSRDMADAMMAQGDVLASLSEELESALYPREMVDELVGSMGGGRARVDDAAAAANALPAGVGPRQLPAPGASTTDSDSSSDSDSRATTSNARPAPPARKPATTATTEAIASGHAPSCDVAPIVAGLLASAEVMAKPSGVTMTATFPEPGERKIFARADPRDVRETLALVIDAALVAAPKGGGVDVVLRANESGVVVATAVTAGKGTPAAEPGGVHLPAGALAAAAAADVGDAFARGSMEETQSLKIARSLVESAGGVFHVLPSLPPTVGRVELWIPAAAEPVADAGERATTRDAAEEDAVDV